MCFQKANETKVEILSFWHPNLTINLVEDYTPWMPGAVPAPINECEHFIKPLFDDSKFYKFHGNTFKLNFNSVKV